MGFVRRGWFIAVTLALLNGDDFTYRNAVNATQRVEDTTLNTSGAGAAVFVHQDQTNGGATNANTLGRPGAVTYANFCRK